MEMGVACSRYGRVAYRVLWGSLMKRGHLENLGVDESMKLN
jgi:hypothetical protein